MATYRITGGAGFIGAHLSESLLRRGHRVLVLDDLLTGGDIGKLRAKARWARRASAWPL